MTVCPKTYAVVKWFARRVPSYALHIAIADVASSNTSNKLAFDGMVADKSDANELVPHVTATFP